MPSPVSARTKSESTTIQKRSIQLVNELIAHYQLSPHPEGGYFRETYRAGAKIPGTQRSLSTAIYYLLPAGQRSRLHKIGADEVWHFYRGDPLLVVELQAG